ncbi:MULTISPECIES: 3-hydroxyacyl-CoA dehydrogenase NAD-binding domain-containing protein [unclassified Streptomyces]|uniref:3-hydroxyacyl-CoA dehydrogenase family protein n=1 Tax=unclassified Streptomyces TaxID=2593676 RepID=UPI0023673AB3|nr:MULTISPECIES: 3-hydroxyacyl-CoA dehydrogenase NAD-binding domain-containing protein [unclassified Streptomyces]MDF3142970.1 3-hydroxyacyl-CoA dehydrogenase NAD-binding domain-containing protein [Streptomyces sp. T21Q-yed]WDF42878.1 3-hydroxyacyl-CoA dehydrogenase NAD-binding domain-containing protein [Streptomyces sp. T12]
MDRIGVVGAGTMGSGVAQLFAERGHSIVLVDVADDVLESARAVIARNVRLAPLVRPGTPAREPEEVTGRILFTTDLKQLRGVDFLIENTTEDWEIKRPLYGELDTLCEPGVPFGVNTSAIPITRVAAATTRQDRVIGTHFMNPAPLKPTVELIRGHHTSDETLARTRALLDGVGKKHVVVADSPGFVTNRVLMLTLNEAVFLLHEGVSAAADIDRLFKECFGHAMGPLETADLIGLDTVLLSLEVLHDNFNDPKYRPCPLLRKLVDAGLHGRKTGQGFHSYESGGLRHG